MCCALIVFVIHRYAQATGEKGDVLLDENLVEYIRTSPLYLRDHSKFVLNKCIKNATDFLAKNDVMDYSLLVGIDAHTNELVVGMIDYIRTFTCMYSVLQFCFGVLIQFWKLTDQ